MISTMILAAGLMPLAQLAPLPHLGTLSEGLHSPARVAIASDDSVLVTDPANDYVLRYDGAGLLLGTFAVPEGPVGVAAHPDGRVFVSLRDVAKVAVYDAAFVRTGLLGDGDPLVTFVRPTDLAIAASTGHIYVTDSGGDRVYGFDATGALTLIFGMHGELNGQFQYPSAVAVDEANNRLIVADHDNFRVQVFTSAGVFTQRFGYRNKYLIGGGDEGWMPRTQGLAVDAAGNIYVADALMSTVRVFNPTGTELGKVVSYGVAPGDLRTPCDLALSNDGSKLYVVSTNTSSVEIYTAPTLGAMAAAHWEAASEAAVPVGTNWSRYDLARRLGIGEGATDGPRIKAQMRRAGINRGSIETGDSAATTASGFDGPHMIDSSVICGRCHGIPGQPGGNPSLTEGQQAVCFSCHAGGGQGLTKPLHELDKAGLAGRAGRTHAWGVPAVNAAVGSVGPPAGGVLESYLDGGNIKCATCHNQHTSESDAPYLRADNTNGAMCRQCHVDHIGHTPSGDWQPTCVDCHDMHNTSSENLSLIAPVVANRTLGTDAAVRFTARTGANSFDDGDPAANDGICQVCHTQTAYHTHDGTGTAHNDGLTCTDCHPHEAGFMPAGGDCTSCHASPQDNGDGLPVGGRRAIVGEFPVGDAHAHYGATLDSGACTVCHDVTTHMNGFVELVDPDSGALYSFVTPNDLTSDPDLSDFCAGCHDADGAARLASPLDPFGNGNAPADVAAKFAGTLQWEEMYGDFCFGTEGTLRAGNSHHDISDTDQLFSGAKIECLNCHGAHNSSASQPYADPFDTTIAWAGNGDNFCLSCHGGGTGPLDPGFPPGVFGPVIDPTDPRWTSLGMDWTTILDGACLTADCSSLRGVESCDYVPGPWYVDYTWTHSAHGLDSKRGWPGYSGAPAADVACMDCHSPHGSVTPANPAGNPYMIRDTVDGTAYVDDGTRTGGFNGPPFETFGTVRDVTVSIDGTTVDWGSNVSLCSTCHANWQAAYSWHDYCGGCMTCHAHGAAFGENDFVGSNSTPCPVPATAPSMLGEPVWRDLETLSPDDAALRPAMHLWDAGPEGLRPETVRPSSERAAIRPLSDKNVEAPEANAP